MPTRYSPIGRGDRRWYRSNVLSRRISTIGGSKIRTPSPMIRIATHIKGCQREVPQPAAQRLVVLSSPPVFRSGSSEAVVFRCQGSSVRAQAEMPVPSPVRCSVVASAICASPPGRSVWRLMQALNRVRIFQPNPIWRQGFRADELGSLKVLVFAAGWRKSKFGSICLSLQLDRGSGLSTTCLISTVYRINISMSARSVIHV